MKKRNLWSLLAVLMVAMLSVSLVSCGDDDDDDEGGSSASLSGLYYYESGYGSRTAYNFVNSNTVEFYGDLTQNFNATWFGESGVKFPLRNGWYYWPGNKHTYSYHIVGDIVVIGTDRYMTISGNTLIYDDFGVVLRKWN